MEVKHFEDSEIVTREGVTTTSMIEGSKFKAWPAVETENIPLAQGGRILASYSGKDKVDVTQDLGGVVEQQDKPNPFTVGLLTYAPLDPGPLTDMSIIHQVDILNSLAPNSILEQKSTDSSAEPGPYISVNYRGGRLIGEEAMEMQKILQEKKREKIDLKATKSTQPPGMHNSTKERGSRSASCASDFSSSSDETKKLGAKNCLNYHKKADISTTKHQMQKSNWQTMQPSSPVLSKNLQDKPVDSQREMSNKQAQNSRTLHELNSVQTRDQKKTETAKRSG
jgi:hypothetical protein